MTTTPVASLRHVYHLNPLRLLIFPLLWVAALGLCLYLSFSSADAFTPAANRMLLVLIGIVSLFVAPFFALMWQSRLVLTPEGITHHQFGYTIRSSWDNVAMLDLTPRVQRLVLSTCAAGRRDCLTRVIGRWVDGQADGSCTGCW